MLNIDNNNLTSNSWYVFFGTRSNLAYKCITCPIPGVTLGYIDLGNSSEVKIQEGGDHLEFDDMVMDFLVDETMENHKTLYKWMREMASSNTQVTDNITIVMTNADGQLSDICVEVKDAFPVNISELPFLANGDGDDLVCTATFRYTEWNYVE